MADEYKPPILASIFRVFGWLDLLGSVIVLGIGLTSYEGRGAGAGVVGFFSGLAGALVLFGLSEVIDYIGQIAHYSRLIYERSASQLNVQSAWNKEVLAALKNVADHTKRALTPAPVPTNPPPPAPASVGRAAARFYYLNLDSQPTGPVTTSELKQLFLDAALEPDSLVCPEGSDQWKKLDEMVTL